MKKYTQHKNYKNSEVPWLGEIPRHWNLRHLRYSARINNGSDFKHIEVLDGGYPVLGTGGEFARVSSFMFDKPSVLLGRKGTVNNPLYIDEPFWTVDTLFYTDIANDTHPKFFYYFCKTIPFDFFQYGTALPSMTQSDLYSIPIPLPDFQEQVAIATFLDHETTKIDALITEKQRLIELLKEKRLAVISHAVTKGLNPNALMKESGVEWLGIVPRHWEIKPLKHQVECLDGKRVPLNAEQRYQKAGNIPYWGANSVVDYVDEALFNEDLILLGEDGAPFFDKNRPVAFYVQGPIWPNNHVHVLRPRPGQTGKFITHLLNCTDYKAFIDGSTRDKLTKEQMSCIPLVCPPLYEQITIVAFLDYETAQIDTLIAESNKAIALLQEHRTALISAAVTGKIDIQPFVNQEAS